MSSKADERPRPGWLLVLGFAVVGVCIVGFFAWSPYGSPQSEGSGDRTEKVELNSPGEHDSPGGGTSSSEGRRATVERTSPARGEESGSVGSTDTSANRTATGMPDTQLTPAERAAEILDIPKQENQSPSYLLDKSKVLFDNLTTHRKRLEQEARRAEKRGDEETARRKRVEAERTAERLKVLEQSIEKLRRLAEKQDQSSQSSSATPPEGNDER